MKTDIHPSLFDTKVICNGCNTSFTTKSTVESITVELCSNCHPFYTGKQKLIDTAGRVDRFEARRKAATVSRAKMVKRAADHALKNADIASNPEETAADLKEVTIDNTATEK